jgi:glycosyltransferase involved in cell wall biosynthesis
VDHARLTVAIPTYNRPAAVLRRLAELDELRNLVDEVVIGDNSEIDDAVRTQAAASGRVVYFRNQANIGGGANFLRVVEASSGEFIWWRGDDDPITPGQAEAVRHAVATATPRLLLLSPTATSVFRGRGAREFCDHFREIRSMGWLSSIILPGAIARQALRYGYVGIASGWANVGLVLGLFRIDPEMEFEVHPITLEAGDFREGGREALQWAFFTTCIHNFPQTAQVLATQELRALYLRRWRATQPFRLIRTMARLRLGYLTQEKVTWRTLRPLVHWDSPRSSVLALTLWAMACLPRFVYQVVFAAVWRRLGSRRRAELELPQLADAAGYIDVLGRLRRSVKRTQGETFV